MIVTDIKSTFNSLKVAQAYAELNNNKIPFGYTVFVNGKPQGFWSEKPTVTDNEAFIADINKNFGITPNLAYHTKQLTIYYSPLPMYSYKSVNKTYAIQPFLESLNPFDNHKIQYHSLAFLIDNLWYYTDTPVSNLPVLLDSIKIYNDIVFNKEKYYGLSSLKLTDEVPKKYLLLAPTPSDVEYDKFTAINYIFKYNQMLTSWRKTSYLKAREFSIALNKLIFRS